MNTSKIVGLGLRCAVVFSLGAGFGWWLAWRHRADDESAFITNKAGKEPARLSASAEKPRLLVAVPPGFESAEGWRLRDLGSPDQQLRAALAKAERTPLEQVPEAMRDIARMNGLEGLAGKYFRIALSARWAEAFPEGCLRNAEAAMSGDGIGIEPFIAVKALAASHPGLMLEQLDHTRGKKGRFAELWTTAAEELAWSEPQGAKKWLTSLPDKDDGAEALLRFLWHEDPDEAKRYAAEKGKMDELLPLWAAKEPAQAVRWSIEAGQPQMIRGAAAAWVRTDPEGCWAYFDGLSSATSRDVFLAPLGELVGRDDPTKGIAWLSTQPPSQARANALGSMAYTWAGSDPEAASGWVSTLAPGGERDRIVARFARAAVRFDPEVAMQWAATIADRPQAKSNIESLYRDWSQSDPKAAGEWLSTSPLATEEMKAKLKGE